MDHKEEPSGTTTAPPGSSIRTQWLNPRRKRFWAIVAILLYTLLGFFVVPLVVKQNVISLIQEDLGRTARVERVEFNPYVLSLRLDGFEMLDTDGVSLLAFDEFFVNFQLSSLFRWAWTFREIRLNGSSFFFERFDAQDSRLARLLDDWNADQDTQSPTEEKTGVLPRLLIHELSVKDGRLDARDNLPARPVETYMSPIDISIHELNTLPDRDGRQVVNISLPNGASLHWEGSLTLAPLNSEGDLVLKDSDLAQTISYIEAMLPLDSISVRMSSRFHYRVHTKNKGELSVEIDDLEVELNELAVSGLSPDTDFLSIQKVSMLGGKLRYPEQSLEFSSIRVEQPRLTAWLSEKGDLSLAQLHPAGSAKSAPSGSAEERMPWVLGLEEFVLEGGSVDLSDHSFVPEVAASLRDVKVSLSQISNAEGVRFPLDVSGTLSEGGSFSLNGELGVLPEFSLEATSQTTGIPLALGQSYLQQYLLVKVEAGALDSTINFSIPPGEPIKAGGSIRIPGLELSDTIENKRLLGWNTLEIDPFELDLGENRIHLSSMIFEQPFGRIVISREKTTNLSGLLVRKDADLSEAPVSGNANSEGPPFSFVIGGIRVNDGSMDFADFSLPLPFSTHIAELGGTLSTIASNSSEPASVKFEGKVDEFGLARIEGTMNVLDPVQHTGITLEFRNLLMSGLSPYSIQFAGQKIDEGKLDLDLLYAIDDGQLNGQNAIVLRDLVLGEKVDNPDAASLPLGLAVALLKDANGVIDVDLPVKGNINDPEFRISGVVWKAFSGLITKIISAPFRLLGKLIGIESEDLGQFEFLAGRADLTPPELEKITQLEEALLQRPELRIEINGVTDPAIDIPALKFRHLRDLAVAQIGVEISDADGEAMMLDVEIRQFLESLLAERNPDIDMATLKAEHMAPPAGDEEGEAVFDELAYSAHLQDLLLESEPVSEEDLENLAQERAQAVRTAFLSSGQFDEGRVLIGESKQAESEDGKWVIMELAVAAD